MRSGCIHVAGSNIFRLSLISSLFQKSPDKKTPEKVPPTPEKEPTPPPVKEDIKLNGHSQNDEVKMEEEVGDDDEHQEESSLKGGEQETVMQDHNDGDHDGDELKSLDSSEEVSTSNQISACINNNNNSGACKGVAITDSLPLKEEEEETLSAVTEEIEKEPDKVTLIVEGVKELPKSPPSNDTPPLSSDDSNKTASPPLPNVRRKPGRPPRKSKPSTSSDGGDVPKNTPVLKEEKPSSTEEKHIQPLVPRKKRRRKVKGYPWGRLPKKKKRTELVNVSLI